MPVGLMTMPGFWDGLFAFNNAALTREATAITVLAAAACAGPALPNEAVAAASSVMTRRIRARVTEPVSCRRLEGQDQEAREEALSSDGVAWYKKARAGPKAKLPSAKLPSAAMPPSTVVFAPKTADFPPSSVVFEAKDAKDTKDDSEPYNSADVYIPPPSVPHPYLSKPKPPPKSERPDKPEKPEVVQQQPPRLAFFRLSATPPSLGIFFFFYL